jgi:hypothetical protein
MSRGRSSGVVNLKELWDNIRKNKWVENVKIDLKKKYDVKI